MAFTIEIKKNMATILSSSQITPGTRVNGQIASGGSHPPRNSTDISAQSRMMLTYSPRKNSRNGVEEYSTMKPATSSDSASSMSNGARWVSASAEMKKITNIGKRMEKAFQPWAWARTMSDRFSDPANSSTVMMTKPMETSYD